jgi:sarcosine oxidase delta subunit
MPLTVTCPFCHAAPGAPCRRVSKQGGDKRRRPLHVARIKHKEWVVKVDENREKWRGRA